MMSNRWIKSSNQLNYGLSIFLVFFLKKEKKRKTFHALGCEVGREDTMRDLIDISIKK